jgi:hypothetical protein
MRLWTVTALLTIGFLALAGLCGWAALRNWRRYRLIRTLPPLDHAEIVDTAPPAVAAPRRWPTTASVDDHRIAAAYRDYAQDKRDAAVLLGDLTVLTAGAALGATFLGLFRGGTHALTPGLAVLAGAFGLVYRYAYGQRWATISLLYEHRRAELHTAATPPPAATSRRIGRFFRRRTR